MGKGAGLASVMSVNQREGKVQLVSLVKGAGLDSVTRLSIKDKAIYNWLV